MREPGLVLGPELTERRHVDDQQETLAPQVEPVDVRQMALELSLIGGGALRALG